MSSNLTLKSVLVAVVAALALFFLIPTMAGKTPKWWPGFLPSDPIHLGLDLQGGMHLVMEVDLAKAVAANVERTSQDMALKLRQEKVRFAELAPAANNVIKMVLLSQADRDKFEELFARRWGEYSVSSEKKEANGQVSLNLILKPEAVKHLKKMASAQALEKIRNRVDQFGVKEPDILPQNDGRILVQLPGVSDPARAKALIGKMALLEFKLVNENADVKKAETGVVPPGSELAFVHERDYGTGRSYKRPIVLYARTLMTGDTISEANVRSGGAEGPYVSITFNSRGARQFGDITSANVKKRLAILLDGKVHSAPVIQGAITGGEAMITGNFSPEEARDLAVVLRTGALPAPVNILEERTVGPSLGADSINAGFLSMVVGFLLVVLFILVYYRAAGFAADMALLLNVVLICGVMAVFGFTLTLPGIAGIILTIGMAVDANVLIFERVREELRLNKTYAAAIETGFAKATITILDANVTTLIAGLVLYQFGTGPVKGFAVTLMIGIVSSLFTALIFTRLLMDFMTNKLGMKKLSI